MKPQKIFIVDDDPDFAEGMAINLEIEGHYVSSATSGEEAVRRFAQEDFDITFMDVRMPGMNGVESFLEIRKLKPDAKVVMMTAYRVEELLRQAIDQGALGVLTKPIESDALLKALKNALPAGIILVADDDPDFVEGLETVLGSEGYAVITARTGAEAIDQALHEDLDILLLDLKMPVLSGLEVYAELKKRGRSLPTIIVTGHDVEEAESLDRLRQMSIAGCLVKPIAAAELLRAIEEIL